MQDAEFYAAWREYMGRAEIDQAARCAIATKFEEHLAKLIFDNLGSEPNRRQIAQFKYLLQEEWHAWRKSVPAPHIRTDEHHHCLDAVYDAAYDRLHLLDLNSRPLVDFLEGMEIQRQLPPAMPVPPTQGIWIGQVE